LCLFGVTTALAQESLEINEPVERQLASSSVQSYSIELKAGDYIASLLDQHGRTDLTIVAPDGSPLRHYPGPTEDGKRLCVFIADIPGSYRFNVTTSATQPVSDLLRAYPPKSQAKWARVESSVNLDAAGNPDPYFASIDLATARHPQTLLARHFNGQPLTVEHGAPLRLLVPVKLGSKNVKAVTRITYSAEEPRDYCAQYGYSSCDGIWVLSVETSWAIMLIPTAKSRLYSEVEVRCPNVSALSIEVSAGIDSGESREPW